MLRREKVMLSTDLAKLYQVEPRTLVQAVSRNRHRFPDDFMFQLSSREFADLESQIVISSWGGLRRARPYAFTEQGVAMLSSVLGSRLAVRVNIEIMRTFVRLRRMLAAHEDLSVKLASLEKKYDGQFRVVFEAIRELMKPPEPPRRQIGSGKDRTSTPLHMLADPTDDHHADYIHKEHSYVPSSLQPPDIFPPSCVCHCTRNHRSLLRVCDEIPEQR